MSSDMVDALTITAVGFGTVFAVLIVLSYCFSAMKLLDRGKREEAAENEAVPVEAPEGPASDIDADASDESELAAVISAALAAFMRDESTVSAIRRVEDTGAWSRTGRHDQMV